jgi:hypothetical protein
MKNTSCNCIICAKEFDPSELHSLALSKINVTRFKICDKCLEMSDPTNDYKEACDIIESYLKIAQAKSEIKK